MSPDQNRISLTASGYDLLLAIGLKRSVMVPLTKDNARKNRVAEFQQREHCVQLFRNRHVELYELKRQDKFEEIKWDFLNGNKTKRIQYLNPDDSR